MSRIGELGQRLLDSLQKISPEFCRGFYPGVAEDEVLATLEPLNYLLPKDFFDLYEWRNGHSEYFTQPVESAMICQFSPIHLVAEDKQWEIWGEEAPTYKSSFLVPFIEEDSRYFAVVVERTYDHEAHIVHVSREGETTLRYDSITSMLSSTVRCFEEDAFYIDQEGWLAENYELSAKILREENPHALAEATLDVMSNLDVYGLDDLIDDDSYINLSKVFLLGLATLRRLKPPNVIEVIQIALSRLHDVSSDRGYAAQYALNRWLNDVKEL